MDRYQKWGSQYARVPTWRGLVQEAYQAAESLHRRMIDLSVRPGGLNVVPIHYRWPSDGRATETKGTIQETADRLERDWCLAQIEMGTVNNLFRRLEPLFEVAHTELPDFTIPGLTIDQTWLEDDLIHSWPQQSFEHVGSALAWLYGSFESWGFGLPGHFIKASQAQSKLETERDEHDEKVLEKWHRRRSAAPYPFDIQAVVIERLKAERGRLRRDLALGIAEELPSPEVDWLRDVVNWDDLPDEAKQAYGKDRGESLESDGKSSETSGTPIRKDGRGKQAKYSADDRVALVYKNTPESRGWKSREVARSVSTESSVVTAEAVRKTNAWKINREMQRELRLSRKRET